MNSVVLVLLVGSSGNQDKRNTQKPLPLRSEEVVVVVVEEELKSDELSSSSSSKSDANRDGLLDTLFASMVFLL